jgi:hypothetical protein
MNPAMFVYIAATSAEVEAGNCGAATPIDRSHTRHKRNHTCR